MDTVRWGIVGLGAIADLVARDLPLVPNAELAAVASRALPKAQAFAAQHGVPLAFGSYRALLEDPTIDVVHIASPHSSHRDIALAAIAHGKAVLVEKAFTATYAGAVAVVEAARSQRVFAMEAMWTRFQPAIVAARRLIADQAIGEVVGVEGDLMARRTFDPHDRLFAPELAGGALLDLGCYVVTVAQHFLGDAAEVNCYARRYANGVDSAAVINLGHTAGGLSTLSIGFDGYGPGRMAIYGSDGWIDIMPRFHHPATLVLHRPGAEPEPTTATPVGLGYFHELVEVTERVRAGDTESPTMPLADTLEVMRILTECARQAGVAYAEQPVDLG